MTFDEWYDYKRMKHLFRPEDIARAAYEAGARSTVNLALALELVQNLAVRIVVATQSAGIKGDSLRAWLTMVKE